MVAAAAPDQSGAIQLSAADAKGRSPEGYVNALIQGGQVQNANGRAQSVGGYPAWVGRLVVARSDGTTTPITAAFIDLGRGSLIQILGQSAPDDAAVLGTIHSFHAASASRMDVTPARVQVVTVERTGSFSTVVAAYGRQAIDLNELSIVNNVEPDETVAAGTLIKPVRKGAR